MRAERGLTVEPAVHEGVQKVSPNGLMVQNQR